MTKQKPTLMDTMLQRTGTMKDYDKAVKLYARYQKEKGNPKREPKLRAELLIIAASAKETMERLNRVYSKVNEAVNEELKNQKPGLEFYPEEHREDYLKVIRERLDNIKGIWAEMGGVAKDGGTKSG